MYENAVHEHDYQAWSDIEWRQIDDDDIEFVSKAWPRVLACYEFLA